MAILSGSAANRLAFANIIKIKLKKRILQVEYIKFFKRLSSVYSKGVRMN
jgi:hypothetical protein